MKKLKNLLPMLAIIAGIVLLSVTSGCKKDDKDNDPPAPKKYRMTTLSSNDEGDEFMMKITYNSDNKITRFSQMDNGVEVYRTDWNWDGNKVTLVSSELENGNWIDDSYYEEWTYTNGHITKREYFNEDLLLTRNIYTWNGDLLTNESVEFYMDTLVVAYNITYNYEGEKLMSSNLYYDGNLAEKQVIEYNNGKPVALKMYDYMNVLEESSELIYTGNNITKINSYHVVEGVQGNIDCTEDRVYDANNCMTLATNACEDNYTYSYSATYEEGASNFNDFILTQISWISVYLYPDTYPSELAYKKKK